MPKIIIHNKNKFSKFSSEIEIIGDNKVVAKIASGRTLEFDLKHGVHSLHAKLGIFGSRKKIFETDENSKVKEFSVAKTKYSLPLAIIAAVALIYVSFFWYLDVEIIFLSAVAYLVLYMFFGFNRFLRLTEIS